MDVVRHAQLDTGMPARPIEHEDDLLGRAGADLACKFGQFDFKHGNADRRRQMEDGPTRGRMHEAHQVTPGEAVLNDGGRTLPNRRPDPSQERLEADAMLVAGP